MDSYIPPFVPNLWLFTIFSFSLCGFFVSIFASIKLQSDKLRNACAEIGYFSFISLFISTVFLLATYAPPYFLVYVPIIFMSPWAAPLAISVGIILFYIRNVKLGVYACIELMLALVTIFFVSLTQFGTTFQRATAIITSVYFLIRGLDNAQKSGLLEDTIIYFQTKSRAFYFRHFLISIIFIAIVGVSLFLISKFPKVETPYLANIKGPNFPVSALECGHLFVVCSKKDWMERERLLKGTAADRMKSYQDAQARVNQIERDMAS